MKTSEKPFNSGHNLDSTIFFPVIEKPEQLISGHIKVCYSFSRYSGVRYSGVWYSGVRYSDWHCILPSCRSEVQQSKSFFDSPLQLSWTSLIGGTNISSFSPTKLYPLNYMKIYFVLENCLFYLIAPVNMYFYCCSLF